MGQPSRLVDVRLNRTQVGSRSAKNFDRSSTISRGERVCTGRQLGENEPALASVAYKAQVEMFND